MFQDHDWTTATVPMMTAGITLSQAPMEKKNRTKRGLTTRGQRSDKGLAKQANRADWGTQLEMMNDSMPRLSDIHQMMLANLDRGSD